MATAINLEDMQQELNNKFVTLSKLLKRGKTPSNAVLGRLCDWLTQQHYVLWRGDSSITLHSFVEAKVKELGINVRIFWGAPSFLVDPKSIITVFYDREGTLAQELWVESTDPRDVAALGYIYDKETKNYYSASLAISYLRLAPAKDRYIIIRDLPWRLEGVIQQCPHCGNSYLKSEMVYNPILEELVDHTCNKKINSIQNHAPDASAPITNYHSHRGAWNFIPRRKNKTDRGMVIGVELEMQSKLGDSEAGAKKAAAHIINNSLLDSPDYYFEWDGSLREGGFEMIANPMTVAYATDWWSKMLPIIRKVCVGYGVEKHFEAHDDASYNYGIHLTVSTKYLPHSVLPKLVKFFDNKENLEFLGAIAQRHVIYGGCTLGTYEKPAAKNRLAWMKGKPTSMASVDRRLPVNIKGKLVEFRMFRSTLNTVSFLKNLEFLDAIITYYRETMTQSIHHRDFILWLAKNRKKYPNLVLYLQHPLYFVKGMGKVNNVWLPLIKELKAKFKVHDVLQEYGPKPIYADEADVQETSMVGA